LLAIGGLLAQARNAKTRSYQVFRPPTSDFRFPASDYVSRSLRNSSPASTRTENLHRDFKELLSLFLAHEVEFLRGGGYAVSVHGYRRSPWTQGIVHRLETDDRIEGCCEAHQICHHMMMRTTINIDDALLAEASELLGEKSVSAVVRKALEGVIAGKARERLARLGGSVPDLYIAPRSDRVREDTP